EVLAVLGVGLGREVVRPQVDPGRRLVEVDDGELMVHADPVAARRLREERRRHVPGQLGGKDRRDVPVWLLKIEAADRLVRDAVDEDRIVRRYLLDRVQNRAARLVQEGQRVEQARGGIRRDVAADGGEQRVVRGVRGERYLRVYSGQPERRPARGIRRAECGGSLRPEVIEGLREYGDRASAAQDHRVVVLHEERPPAEVRRPARHHLDGRAVGHDGLVVLQVPHVLAFHIGGARRGGQPLRGL